MLVNASSLLYMREVGNSKPSRAISKSGEEKGRVHMNVVPRSTMNTNSGTEN